ncbi:MAG: hypothetical protein BIFFINMI_00920 [Phycisphaerae bacterium]|nr:hypothetical protein [Phycisphaerae bacterium]
MGDVDETFNAHDARLKVEFAGGDCRACQQKVKQPAGNVCLKQRFESAVQAFVRECLERTGERIEHAGTSLSPPDR